MSEINFKYLMVCLAMILMTTKVAHSDGILACEYNREFVSKFLDQAKLSKTYGGDSGTIKRIIAKISASNLKQGRFFLGSLNDGAVFDLDCSSKCGKEDIVASLENCSEKSAGQCRIVAVTGPDCLMQIHYPSLQGDDPWWEN